MCFLAWVVCGKTKPQQHYRPLYHILCTNDAPVTVDMVWRSGRLAEMDFSVRRTIELPTRSEYLI